MSHRLFPACFSVSLLTVILGFLSSLASLSGNERVALVIGNDSYENIDRLDEARNDANRIGEALREIGFTVEFLLDGKWKDTRSVIERFAANHADAALAVVYFAGHGVEIAGEHYLIPVDSNPTSESSFEHEAIPLGYLLGQLEDHQNCLRVIILDACRNNPFAKKATTRALGAPTGLGARTKPAPKQTLIAYSANTGQEALDGMYTPALLNHLRNPELRGEEVFYAIANEVSEKTNGTQEPAMYITGGRPFSFHSDSGSLPQSSSQTSPTPVSDTPVPQEPGETQVPGVPQGQPEGMQITKEEVEAFLHSWIAAWESKDIVRYSNHYGSYFAGSVYSHVSGHKSLTRRAWMTDKAEKFGRAVQIEVNFTDASYETDGETVILLFTQDFYTSYGKEPYRDNGQKILLLRREDGELKIMNEKFFPPDVRHSYANSSDSGLYSVIATFVSEWADAWESRDLNRYSSFYSESFQGKKGSSYLGYDAWMADMAGKFQKAGSISVGMGELDIQEAGDRYTVEYKQTYKSSTFSDVGYKTLTLVKDSDGNLKIVGESWRAN